MNETTREKLNALIDERINHAISTHKQQVKQSLIVWTSAISVIFSFFAYLGFSQEEFLYRLRSLLIPKSYIIDNLSDDHDDTKLFKKHIMQELHDPDLKFYPNVKATIENNVWGTLRTKDEAKINSFLQNTLLDEAIISSHRQQIDNLLFDPSISKNKKAEEIMKLGKEPKEVLIGVFNNENNANTNCNLPFRHDKKRVILYFPPSSKIQNNHALPWFDCPNNYPYITVSLTIDDVSVDGIMVVGVERPTEEDRTTGVRARVSTAVSQEFKNKGMSLNPGVTRGYISVADATPIPR